MVAVDTVPLRQRHVSESWIRIAVAAVRGVFCLRVPFNEYEDEVKQTGISPVEREQETARSRGVVTEITEDFLPERPSMDVETFNRLNAPTRKRRRNDSAQTNSEHDEDQQ